MRAGLICAAVLAVGFSATGAMAQSVGGTTGGMDSNNRSMSGPNIDVDNGLLANGTPRQQAPGVSMTNGPAVGGYSSTSSGTLNGDGAARPGGAAALPPVGAQAPARN